MIKFLVRLIAVGATIFAISRYLPLYFTFLPPLIQVKDFETALMAALILAIINALVRPVVVFITIPLTFLTIGLFSLVINALMLYLVSFILGDSFNIMGWWQSLIATFIISVVNALFSSGKNKD